MTSGQLPCTTAWRYRSHHACSAQLGLDELVPRAKEPETKK